MKNGVYESRFLFGKIPLTVCRLLAKVRLLLDGCGLLIFKSIGIGFIRTNRRPLGDLE